MSIFASALTVEVTVASEGWRSVCPAAERLVAATAELALSHAGVSAALPEASDAAMGVTLTDDAEQRQLNLAWRGKDASTNVLAFPAFENGELLPAGAPLLLGDVVLAFETVAREAREQDKSVGDHLQHLVVHGVLHLLGFDHQNDTEAAIMESQEIAILARLGVPNPYSDPI